MSLKDNLNDAKSKLSSDQTLLISAFRLESFYRKNKILIYIIIVLAILFGIYKGYEHYMDSKMRQESEAIMNELYSVRLIDDRKRSELESKLEKSNPVLYDFYVYTTLQKLSLPELGEKKNLDKLHSIMDSKNKLIATLATYQYATISENLDLLENFSDEVSKLLRDKARYQAAYLYMQKGEVKRAREILSSITLRDDNQDVYNMAVRLRHYGVALESDTKDSIKDSAESAGDSK